VKSGGRAVFILGAVLVGIMTVWGFVGFYVSAIPILLLLGSSGIALMAVGSKMNKDKEPNKAVQWQPVAPQPVVSAADAPTPAVETSTLPPMPAFEAFAEYVPWALVGRNGARYQLASSNVVGRDPGDSENTITLTGADFSVSKVHAQVTVLNGTVRVRDMGSANGTVVVTPHGVEVECEQDNDTVMAVGSTLELGNCALALVASPSAEEQ